MSRGRSYSDPYFAGIGIGIALLGAYVLAGRGLGASGALASVAAPATAALVGPSAATAPYVAVSPWRDWLVLELVGVMVGGFLSAWLAGRLQVETERGPGINNRQRIFAALAGGLLMGVGAKFA